MIAGRAVLAIVLASAFGVPPAVADGSPVAAVVSRVDGSTAARYSAIVAREAAHGSSLVPKKAVTWTFRGRSGSFLLAQAKAKGTTRCVVYLLRGTQTVSLGGNDDCTWEEDPILVWDGDKAWLEFPRAIKRPADVPLPSRDFTAHFSKAGGDVCLLGLPLKGYDTLRCPHDEPPDSR